MEINKGASVSLISKKEWTIEKGSAPLLALEINKVPRLYTYAGSSIQPLGQVQLKVDNNNVRYNFHAFVSGLGPNLLGNNWLSVLKMNSSAVHQVDRDDFLEPYQTLFSEGLCHLPCEQRWKRS